MLRKRLVTVLTFCDGVLFRTKQFEPDYRYTLNFVDAWSVDEIVLLDVTRPGQGCRENFERVVSEFAERCFVPLTVGGGIRTLDDIKRCLAIGADKVAMNWALHANPALVSEAVRLYGSQCIVASIDAKCISGGYTIRCNFGTENHDVSPAAWAVRVQSLGVGEILLQSIDRDGSLEGYDNVLNRMVSEAVHIPVLVCGGAGRWQHFVEGFQDGGAQAVCTTNIYHFTEVSILSAKSFLRKAGVLVRG